MMASAWSMWYGAVLMADAGADGGKSRDCWRAGRTGLQVLEPKSARRHPVSTPSIRAPCLHPHANSLIPRSKLANLDQNPSKLVV